MRTSIVMDKEILEVNMPCRLLRTALYNFFWVSQYTSVFIIAPCSMNTTNITLFLSQKTVAITFLADTVFKDFLFFLCIVWFHQLLFYFDIHVRDPNVISFINMWSSIASSSMLHGSRKIKVDAICCNLYCSENVLDLSNLKTYQNKTFSSQLNAKGYIKSLA